MRALITFVSLLCCGLAHAYTPTLDDLAGVALVELSPVTVKAAVIEAKHRPLQFAVGTPLAIGTSRGTWDQPEAGIARWRLRVGSSGAKSLSFAFDSLQLPPGAALYLYGSAGADVQGPYTSADNGSFVTPIARGDEVVLEARMPTDVKSAFSLHAARAFHAFRDFSTPAAKGYPGATGKSGACEINVACPAGNAYRDEIRSTVLLTVIIDGEGFFCSGSLVNNTAQDDRALVLTANHCRGDNVTETIAYFNVQRSACSLGTAGTVTQNIHGKTLLSGTSGKSVTDFLLFELASAPPSSYNVHYDGWEVSPTAPTSGAVIHHPAGDDKKISLYTQTATTADDICFTDVDSDTSCAQGFKADTWEVHWSTATTEGGSSGSGLLNQNKRIVGTLSGGNGACDPDAPTQGNGEPDYFARLDRAWTAASSTGTTLQTALAGSSGCTSLDGKDPGRASAVDCNGAATGGSTTGGSTTGSGGSDGGGALGILLSPLAIAALWRRRKSPH
ncbi:trypsin-like serine peptidase [Solimonas soli]|uniref:trypsin-like serine peptidase n=1 Tax=Solimonas soli TaxID=413479 RepID=UPI00048994E3|nr:trypsin-like peptidase domain-containing protein [Solimonas soli]